MIDDEFVISKIYVGNRHAPDIIIMKKTNKFEIETEQFQMIQFLYEMDFLNWSFPGSFVQDGNSVLFVAGHE